MRFPAFCTNPKCRCIFESPIQVSHCTAFTVSNVSTLCPKCKSLAEVPSGTFNVTGSFIEVLKAPTTTIDYLTRLRDLLNEANLKQDYSLLSSDQNLSILLKHSDGNTNYLLAIIPILIGIASLFIQLKSFQLQKEQRTSSLIETREHAAQQYDILRSVEKLKMKIEEQKSIQSDLYIQLQLENIRKALDDTPKK